MKLVSGFVVLFFLALPVSAEPPGGKELFSMPLGSNGKSCSSCHAQGKGLEEVGSYSRQELSTNINICIRKALQGEELAADDPRLASLEDYVRHFGE